MAVNNKVDDKVTLFLVLSLVSLLILFVTIKMLKKYVKYLYLEKVVYKDGIKSLEKETCVKEYVKKYSRYIINEEISIYGENSEVKISDSEDDFFFEVKEYFLKKDIKIIQVFCNAFVPTHSKNGYEKCVCLTIPRSIIESKLHESGLKKCESNDIKLEKYFLKEIKNLKYQSDLMNINMNYLPKYVDRFNNVYEHKFFVIF